MQDHNFTDISSENKEKESNRTPHQNHLNNYQWLNVSQLSSWLHEDNNNHQFPIWQKQLKTILITYYYQEGRIPWWKYPIKTYSPLSRITQHKTIIHDTMVYRIITCKYQIIPIMWQIRMKLSSSIHKNPHQQHKNRDWNHLTTITTHKSCQYQRSPTHLIPKFLSK